jgi:hypothetical protein
VVVVCLRPMRRRSIWLRSMLRRCTSGKVEEDGRRRERTSAEVSGGNWKEKLFNDTLICGKTKRMHLEMHGNENTVIFFEL